MAPQPRARVLRAPVAASTTSSSVRVLRSALLLPIHCLPAPTLSHFLVTPSFLPLPQMTFMVTFDVSPKAILGDRLLLTANVSRWAGPGRGQCLLAPSLLLWGPCQLGSSSFSSENTTPRTSKTTFQMELMVKYAIYTVISRYHTTSSKAFFSITLMGLRKDFIPCSISTSGTFRFYHHLFNW